MDFGKLDDISQVDFALPPDHPDNKLVFARNGNTRHPELQVYVGCAKWGRKDWIGKIYPKGTKEKDFLEHYVKHFNSIELNATFYNLYPRNITEKWAATAGSDFRFCPKFTNSISHYGQLNNVQRETELFLDSCMGFSSKLGSAFLQLSDRFSPKRVTILQQYLKQLPRDFPVCVELRHPDWFTPCTEAEETFALMRELGIGTVITDTSGRRDCLHMRLTTDTAFVRYVGNNLHPTDYTRIDDWVKRMKSWIDKGIRNLYFFIHSHEELNSPEMADYTIAKLNKTSKLKLKPPALLNGGDGPTLF